MKINDLFVGEIKYFKDTYQFIADTMVDLEGYFTISLTIKCNGKNLLSGEHYRIDMYRHSIEKNLFKSITRFHDVYTGLIKQMLLGVEFLSFLLKKQKQYVLLWGE